MATELTPGSVSIDVLRELGHEGAPLPLIDGRGNVLGVYVLDDIQETQSVLFQDGAARKVSFTMKLTRVDETEAGGLMGLF